MTWIIVIAVWWVVGGCGWIWSALEEEGIVRGDDLLSGALLGWIVGPVLLLALVFGPIMRRARKITLYRKKP